MNQERAFILFDYYYYYKIDSIKYTYSIRLQYINKAINPLEKKNLARDRQWVDLFGPRGSLSRLCFFFLLLSHKPIKK
jgi:hypothetical protein